MGLPENLPVENPPVENNSPVENPPVWKIRQWKTVENPPVSVRFKKMFQKMLELKIVGLCSCLCLLLFLLFNPNNIQAYSIRSIHFG
jgi:hypothetical protein